MLRAVLFKSEIRFEAFRRKLTEYGVDCTVLDFARHDWLDFDFNDVDFVIYYPTFKYSSCSPYALQEVHDNLSFIATRYPSVKIYPDPKLASFYNDKYRQYLYLRDAGCPIPRTCPLLSKESFKVAEDMLGYPMVLKNRHGASGTSVFKVKNRKDLEKYYKISTLDVFNLGAVAHFVKPLFKRVFYYQLIKARRAPYPFLTPPLLAQEYIDHDRDLKTVVGHFKVVEAHWRFKATDSMWKVNIDAGGIGQWSHVPPEPIEISERIARDLNATWINFDIILKDGKYLITEFSPVWHHYAYREKPSFVYRDDYNIEPPLEVSLDLEHIIVESLIKASEN